MSSQLKKSRSKRLTKRKVLIKKEGRPAVRRHITEKAMLRAIKGSGGVVKLIAERLGCTWHAVYRIIKSEKWPNINLALEEEKEFVGDLAEETIRSVMEQRIDLASAARTARWYLERRHRDRGFTETKEVQVSGGDRPVRVEHEHYVDVDKLRNLPLDVRVKLLEAMDEQNQGEEIEGEIVNEGE